MNDDFEKGHVGQSFDDFLREEGTYEETSSVAIKRLLSWQLQQLMEAQHLSKVAMATKLETSRSQLDRLLDPENDSVTLGTLNRAAKAVGRTLKLEIV